MLIQRNIHLNGFVYHFVFSILRSLLAAFSVEHVREFVLNKVSILGFKL